MAGEQVPRGGCGGGAQPPPRGTSDCAVPPLLFLPSKKISWGGVGVARSPPHAVHPTARYPDCFSCPPRSSRWGVWGGVLGRRAAPPTRYTRLRGTPTAFASASLRRIHHHRRRIVAAARVNSSKSVEGLALLSIAAAFAPALQLHVAVAESLMLARLPARYQ